MTTLEVQNLSFDYDTRPVLRGVGFSVTPGTICGLLGPNASGKTTLFKCMNGILRPQEGQVTVGGQRIGGLSRKAVAGLMAVVPQQTSAVFPFTALQMVVMAQAARLSLWGKPSKKDLSRAQAALDELGAGHLGHRFFNELSGGEKQIVLLARALFQEPAVLLLDEPTAHLDFKNQHRIMEMVRAVTRKKNLISIISLHDPNLAARYCGQMVMLKQGRVHEKGMAKEVFRADALAQVFGIQVGIAENCCGKYLFIPPTQDWESTLH